MMLLAWNIELYILINDIHIIITAELGLVFVEGKKGETVRLSRADYHKPFSHQVVIGT